MRYLLLTFYTQASGKIDEAMTVTKTIRRKDWQTVNVILDFKECKVVKSIINGEAATKDWDTIVSYYYPYYTTIIERLFIENGHDIPLPDPKEPATTEPVTG
jgi:hypothetical protein